MASPVAVIRKERSTHVVQRDADNGKLSRRVSGIQPGHSACEILRQGDFFPENGAADWLFCPPPRVYTLPVLQGTPGSCLGEVTREEQGVDSVGKH